MTHGLLGLAGFVGAVLLRAGGGSAGGCAHAADLQRQRIAGQPWLGPGGMRLGAAAFFALALGTGNTTTSLLILGPISTFALPAVAMVAFW